MIDVQALTENLRRSRPVSIWLVGALLAAVIALVVNKSEVQRPGYGLWSWVTKDSATFAAARTAHEKRVEAQKLAAEAQIREEREYYRRRREDDTFIGMNTDSRRVVCLDSTKWPTLAREEKGRLLKLLESRFMRGVVCP